MVPGGQRLRPGYAAADQDGMTSSASPTATWLPAAIARAAVVTAPPAQNVPRSGSPGASEAETLTAMTEDLFDWLGFADAG